MEVKQLLFHHPRLRLQTDRLNIQRQGGTIVLRLSREKQALVSKREREREAGSRFKKGEGERSRLFYSLSSRSTAATGTSALHSLGALSQRTGPAGRKLPCSPNSPVRFPQNVSEGGTRFRVAGDGMAPRKSLHSGS
jgi:hypothetical protein